MTPTQAWDQLRERSTELTALEGLMGLVEWDQQVMMPRAGALARGEQLSLLSGLHHDKVVDPALSDILGILSEADLDPIQAASVRNLGRTVARSARVPSELVRRGARIRAASFPAWAKAKGDDDFASFQPHLEELVAITKETIAHIKTDQADDYDVLLEAFDPGSTVADLDDMFGRLKPELGKLLDAIDGVEGPARLEGSWSVESQKRLHHEVAQALGFSYEQGRLDDSEHPFTVGIAPGDVRITTHIYPEGLLSGLSGTIHETGHGLYEQGIPLDLHSTPAGGAASFGLHESQSRFWENTIGRSRAFCVWLAPLLKKHVGQDFDVDALYGASNRVERSLIRVFADEATYNLHIAVRYDLERRIFSGELSAADLPEAWREAYRETLGVCSEDDEHGVLQDVHWAGGMFAYFPSYTLGNLYAASLGAKLLEERPQLWEEVERGEFAPTLAWLRSNIHHKAHLQDAPAIVEAAAGERDHVKDLVEYLWSRHGALHGVSR